MTIKKALYFAVIIAFVVGCGEDSDPDSNPDNESNTDQTNQTNNDNNQNGPPTYLDDPFNTGYGDVMGDMAHLYNEISTTHCQCYHLIDYNSEDECLAEETESVSTIESFTACLDHSMAIHDEEPPQGMEDLIDCKSDAATQGNDCLAEVKSEHGEICSEDGIQAIESCISTYTSLHNACRSGLEESTAHWYVAYTEVVRDHDCFDYIRWVN